MRRAPVFLALLLMACGPAVSSSGGPAGPPEVDASAGVPAAEDAMAGTQSWLDEGERAMEAGEPARAVTGFTRALEGAGEDRALLRRASLGLASAYERLRDCPAALRVYGGFVERFPGDPDLWAVHARQGACQAEIGEWERSASSFALSMQAGDGLSPSTEVELLARRGYALFHLDRFEEADAALAEADEIYLAAEADQSERFSTYYFVGMARFYRGAIWHRRFRDVQVRLPEARMARDFETKLELLQQAQAAYNRTIEAKHVYWVSAAGFQLGSLFSEFYDELMYAPVPEWLDERQRRIYYEELKNQLRPVIDKAIWVYERNLETARRLGYDNPFIDETQTRLGELQAVLLAGDTELGVPHPRIAPPGAAPDLDPGTPDAVDTRSAANRKLFIPRLTSL